jgi:hypothetical protein
MLRCVGSLLKSDIPLVQAINKRVIAEPRSHAVAGEGEGLELLAKSFVPLVHGK